MSKEIKKKDEDKIGWMDIEDLARVVCNCSEDDEREEIEDAVFRKFDISLEQFESVVEALWPIMDMGISPITDTPFMGFSDKASRAWVIKKDISKQFLASVIQWCGGNDIKKGDSGMSREVNHIKPDGTMAYEITITKP
jgi:hypothetical protein